MLIDGLILMIVGMSVVFIFLTIMVIVMNCMTGIFQLYSKLFPEKKEESGMLEKVIDKNDEIAVVVAAVKAYVKG